MKKSLLLHVSVLFVSFPALCQDWKLVDENKTYFYKHSDSLHITNTISIEAVSGSLADTTFKLGTTIRVCDTCTSVPFEAFDGNLYHFYEPELFGHEVFYDAGTNSYLLNNGIIHHAAELSESWTFSTGVTATVVHTGDSVLFSTVDSIKIIALSTLDTIVLSKNLGILRYPDFDGIPGDYYLCGLHHGTTTVGEFLPNARTIYDFSPGDIFCYHNYGGNAGIGEYLDGHHEIRILENLSNADTIRYKVRLVGYTHISYFGLDPESGFPPYNQYINDVIFLSIADNGLVYENTFGVYDELTNWINEEGNGGDLNFYNILPFWDPDFVSCDQEALFTDYTYDNEHGYVKRVVPYHQHTDSLYYFGGDGVGSFFSSEFYVNGLGRLFTEKGCFEHFYSENLVAWVKDGDTTGTLYNFPDDLGIGNEVLNQLMIYPNPASSYIHVPSNIQTISIYSVSGELVLQVENDHPVFIGDLIPGLYFVVGLDDQGLSHSGKLMIKNE